jgi:hypothetical protein
MKMLRGGAPKYFLALRGGRSESSRYTEGGGRALNFSKFVRMICSMFMGYLVQTG